MIIRFLILFIATFLSAQLYGKGSGLCKGCYESEVQVTFEAIADITQKIRANESLCDFPSQGQTEKLSNRKSNCLKLLMMSEEERGLSQKALEYTLKTFKLNLGKLKDNSCIEVDATPDGIKNPCQMLINDMNSKSDLFPDKENRSNSYYIDLCAEGSTKIISKSYVNKGVGSGNGSYKDINDINTTVIGAFLTGSKLTKFTPNNSKATGKISTKYTDKGWSWTDNRCSEDNIIVDGNKTDCPFVRVELFGIQDSNNTSVYANKPMHTSPLFSSWGCPSLGMDDNWKMVQLAVNGPSLVMNWGPARYHTDESLTNCHNDN